MHIKTIVTFLLMTLAGSSLSAQNFVWAKQLAGSGSSSGSSSAFDAAGNLYIRGSFLGTVDFDPGSGIFNLTSEGPYSNTYILKLDAEGNFVWAKQIRSEYGAGKIVADAVGTIYTSGLFNNTVDFDPGAGVFNMTSAGNSDYFILKLDTSGNFIWAKRFGNASFSGDSSLSIDIMGHIYYGFNSSGTIDLDPGPGVFNLTPIGNSDLFLSKLDAMGNFLWGNQFGGSNSSVNTSSMTTDLSGNIYIAGAFGGQTVDFDPSSNTFNLDATGNGADSFVTKLDTTGGFVWAKQITGQHNQNCTDIILTNSGDIYIAGSFFGTADFDASSSVYNLSSTIPTQSDLFFSKWDNSGNFIWAKGIGGNSFNNDFPDITVDSAGNMYSTGFFPGTLDFDPGTASFELTSNGAIDIFVFKLDASGNFNWAHAIGGVLNDSGSAIVLSPSEDIYITGSYIETVDFDTGAGVFNLTTTGTFDTFILKLDNVTLGVPEWIQEDIKIYPIPTNGNFTINLGREFHDVTIQVSNLFNQVISSSKYLSVTTIQNKLAESAGVYFIKVITSEGTFKTIKIIKE